MEWIRTALGLVLSGHAGYCVVRVAYRLVRRKGTAGFVFETITMAFGTRHRRSML